ncbi:cytidine deaminase [Streptomyces globosus]|uniref:Cytidine deaminase n=1 Tax=Streptomyces globosus TaxID=68209 RepID=A0A344U5J0_9ACTN|nr:cytidine deaminase [Streptomyces globosus]AXE26161.1 cytidine deaminase [Streptomyces globosus]
MDNTTHLPQEDLELVEFARHIVEANGDGEAHTVGAAVRDAQGRMFGGINLYHFTGGPCAELVALGHARAEGARDLAAIVAVGDRGRGVLAPCGRDRQILLDHHPGIRVLVPVADGIRSVPITDLLPHAYVWAEQSAAPDGAPDPAATQIL